MDREILGDKKKQRRYDESLVDKVNAKYAKEVVSGENDASAPDTKIETSNIDLSLPFHVFEPDITDLKTHDRWREYWKKRDCELMSLKEFYAFAKFFKETHHSLPLLSKQIEDGSELIFATSIKYEQSKGFNEVTVRPVQREARNWLYGLNEGKSVLNNVIDTFSGWPGFIRDIFDTEDHKNTIMDTLEFATGVKKENIWMQFHESELFEKPEDVQGGKVFRVVVLKKYYKDDKTTKYLVIHCDKYPSFTGKSLGVKYKSNKTVEEI